MNTRPFLRWLSYTLSALGIILLGYCAYVLIEAKIFQARETARLERLLVRRPPPGPEAPVAPRLRPDPGSTLGKLEIDRLGVSAVVLEGTDTQSLKLGVGHLASSALPGETGNMVLAGHRDTFFRPLREIRAGDMVRFDTPDGTHRYLVQSTIVVKPEQTEVLHPTPEPTLTLVTCFPFYFVGHAPERFIVKAREVAASDVHSTALTRPADQEERPSPLRGRQAPRIVRRKPIAVEPPVKPEPVETAAVVPPPLPVTATTAPAPKPTLPEPQFKADPPGLPPSAPLASAPEPRREYRGLSRLNPVRAVGRLGKLFHRQPKRGHTAPPDPE